MREAPRSLHSLEESARKLAAGWAVNREAGRPRTFRRGVVGLKAELRTAIERLVQLREPSISIGTEWIFDNEYLVLRAIDQILIDLPAGFFRVLPKVHVGGASRTRIGVVAREFLAVSEGFVDVQRIERFVKAFQSVTALDTGEVWALPAFLRLAVVEDVVEAATRATRPELEADINERMAAAIGSLRVLDSADWAEFFESVSVVDRYLRLDPHGTYTRLDFDTRDTYRGAVEELARWSRLSEGNVARLVLEWVRETDRPLGTLVVGPEREAFETRLGCRVPPARSVLRLGIRLAGHLYFGAVALLSLGALLLLVLPLLTEPGGFSPLMVTVTLLLGCVPATSLAIALANDVATRITTPRRLPRLDFRRGIPDDARTLVAVPALLTDAEEIGLLLRQLELNHRGNTSPNLPIALLADPVDADQRARPEDQELVELASAGIRELNERHRTEDCSAPFLLLTRERRWNPNESRWMAWERKRGKLDELNRLLLGQPDSGLRVVEGDPEALVGVRYVLTLDADTFLPDGVAARLIGTLAHPLNAPRFDSRGRVVSGYSVLQPRVETFSDSDPPTWFSRIFQASDGFDLYSHAASDVYQDLFGEGIFAGKGLYDVAAFERSLAGRVPENALLSHDLFEGVHGRAGLVSDVSVIEGYPSHPIAYMRRLHRWVRGDWQIAPWLFPNVPSAGGARRPNELSALDRWKIFDNLRRSLLAVSLVTLTAVGWLWLPGSFWWSAIPFVVVAIPILLPELFGAVGRWRSPRREAAFRASTGRTGWAVARWLVGVAILPWQAWVEADAIIRTLSRLLVTRRHLLQWTSASATARSLAGRSGIRGQLLEPLPGAAISLAVGAGSAVLGTFGWVTQAPVLALWIAGVGLSPILARELPRGSMSLSDDDTRRLRRLARRTWAYFDRLVSADDHWLPPDNLQIRPVSALARRTSPTNIGFGMLAQLVGSDLGFVPPSRLVATLASTLDTVDRVDKHRGHLLNWYDTRHLRPLSPRYVSSVDSGNLAVCALTVRVGLDDLTRTELPGPRYADGLVDALEILAETLESFRGVKAFRPQELPGAIRRMATELHGTRTDPVAFFERLRALTGVELPTIESDVAHALESGERARAEGSLSAVREWVRGLDGQANAIQEEIEVLVPWVGALSRPPRLFTDGRGAEGEAAWRRLLGAAPSGAALKEIPSVCAVLLAELASLDSAIDALQGSPDHILEARRWTADLAERLRASRNVARALLHDLESLRARLATLVREMDFGFLYDPSRRLLRVGYHVERAMPDPSHYDLYASEARLASFVAIAKGDVPVAHWMRLGRPFARRGGTTVLLSWAGTMFEYLMPSLFFRTPRGSLADVACRRAVEAQIRYGRRRRIPWGFSESGFHQTDAHNIYRYSAFGIGELGVRREKSDRIVTAPYASVLALRYDPSRTVRNLLHLERMGAAGALGFYEAADFGSAGTLRRPQVVRSFMAHHQGMVLAALDNFLTGSALVERFHRDPRVAAFEYLLYEAAPGRVRVQPPPSLPRLTPARPPAPPSLPTWSVDPYAFPTPTTVVSNGALSSLLTAVGSGGLRWRGRDVLRWRPDPTVQAWGTWIYVRDVETDHLWSATLAPTWVEPDRYEVVFGADVVEFQREDHEIAMRTSVVVATPSDVEVRRVTMVNESSRPRTLELTSYAEVALADPAEDRRHPAFSKLFVEGRYASGVDALLLERRVRGEEAPAYLAHAMATEDAGAEATGWHLDRSAFLGRGGDERCPRGVGSAVPPGPADVPWAPLDPIISITTRVDLAPGQEVTVVFLTAIADSPGAALATLDAYRSPDVALFAASQARDRERALLQNLSLDGRLLPAFQRLLTAIVFPYHGARASPEALSGASAPHQESLWAAGISGDLPVVVVEAEREGVLLDELVRAQAFWRKHGVRFDLVTVGKAADGYEQPLRGHLSRVLSELGLGDRLDRPGGLHYIAFGRMAEQALGALRAAASVALVEDGRSLAEHLQVLERAPPQIPPFVPVAATDATEPEIEPVLRSAELAFDNGIGGFSADGSEYTIHLEPGASCPAPWSNVVAHEGFGFLVTETGGGFTWLENSGERRLTAWRNDPVVDVPSEALYLRDEETNRLWSATPAPAPSHAAYQVVHRAGSTSFRHRGHGLDQTLELFTPQDESIKVAELRLTNEWSRPRRLTATYYAEWVVGVHRWTSGPHVTTEVSRPDHAILARNRFSPANADVVAFLGASEPIHAFTCDRTEFLGSDGCFSRPAGLVRIGLEGRTGAALDPCAVLQVHLDMAPGETRTIRFLLGAAASREEALELLRRFRRRAGEDTDRPSARAWKDETVLGRLTVRTPEPAMDVLLNHWLLYQTVSCRLWGRSGLYQSSGAFGFRDQLQDSLALLTIVPEVTRSHILEAAHHQFAEGDVLHWWHADTDRGVRTRCSDDLLWLPFAVVEYVEATGDVGILDETVPFLAGAPLAAGEMERYAAFNTLGAVSLYDHCRAALERAEPRSDRGLPFIGSGDWNDALNRVGWAGRGESVWLAWFLYDVETRFAHLAEARGDGARAASLRSDAERLRRAVETHAWDGAWYRRATYDDGKPLGTSKDAECMIDSLTQSWAVLSGGANDARARTAMDSVDRHLIRRDDRLLLLLTPPFHETPSDPGYIRSYPPGVRENGGQYTHAAVWVGFAFAALGEGDRAEEVFRILNPISHASDPESARLYRVEPYVVAADVYGAPPHTGRGGWTWYTGSAAWLYRLGIEGILGLRPAHGGLRVKPCIPRSWEQYEARVRVGTSTSYEIVVRNPHRLSTGAVSLRLDDRDIEGAVIPLEDDGGEHQVEAIIEPDHMRTAGVDRKHAGAESGSEGSESR